MVALLRTTLTIDDDLFAVARHQAREKSESIGKVLSDLARQALTPKVESSTRNGLPLFPRQPGAGIVTLELVNQLLKE